MQWTFAKKRMDLLSKHLCIAFTLPKWRNLDTDENCCQMCTHGLVPFISESPKVPWVWWKSMRHPDMYVNTMDRYD